MQTPFRPFAPLFLVLASAILLSFPLAADEVLKTNIPGGDGKELMDNPRDPDQPTGAIIRDDECAKKTMKGKKLNSGKPNPEYEKCVQAKVEKVKKTGNQ